MIPGPVTTTENENVDLPFGSLLLENAMLYKDVHVVATRTNTTPWFHGTIGERLLQKWGYKHVFKSPCLPNTRYALVQHEFRGLKADDERYTEAVLHVDGCNLMFDWARKGIANVYAQLQDFVTSCNSIQLTPIVYFDFEKGGKVADHKYDDRLKIRMQKNDTKLPVHFTLLLGMLLKRLGVDVKYISGIADAAIFTEVKISLTHGKRAFVYSRDWGFVYASQQESNVRIGVLRNLLDDIPVDGAARCSWGTCLTVPYRSLDDIRVEWASNVLSEPYLLMTEPWEAMRTTLKNTKTLRVRHEHSKLYNVGRIKCSAVGYMTPLYTALACILKIPILVVKQPKLSPCYRQVMHRIIHVSATDASAKVVRKLESNPSALKNNEFIQMTVTNPKALDLVMETWMIVCVVNGEDAGQEFIEWIYNK
jgi:hypothetical protein